MRPAETLTSREREIIALVALGWPNRAIGAKLGSTEQTVKNQMGSIFNKLGFDNRTEVALWAQRRKAA